MKDHHHTSMAPGRPRMVISIEWLRAMVNEGKDDKDIVADLARQGIHVSPKTIQRRRIEFGMLFLHIYFNALFFSSAFHHLHVVQCLLMGMGDLGVILRGV